MTWRDDDHFNSNRIVCLRATPFRAFVFLLLKEKVVVWHMHTSNTSAMHAHVSYINDWGHFSPLFPRESTSLCTWALFFMTYYSITTLSLELLEHCFECTILTTGAVPMWMQLDLPSLPQLPPATPVLSLAPLPPRIPPALPSTNSALLAPGNVTCQVWCLKTLKFILLRKNSFCFDFHSTFT